jgi:hypothetical protein
METQVNFNSLERLAQLLANENVFIQHKNVQTANFNLNSRVLTLPNWSNVSRELYHMFVLHEVGHALWTDHDKWVETANKHGNIMSVVNIIEDARIELMLKNKFPGARYDFRMGYRELVSRDFFGETLRNIHKASFADRINIHFKVGDAANVKFTPTEMKWVKRIECAKTFDDVVEIALGIKSESTNGLDIELNMRENSDDSEDGSYGNVPANRIFTPNKSDEESINTESENGGIVSYDNQNALPDRPLSPNDLISKSNDEYQKAFESLANKGKDNENTYLLYNMIENYREWIVPYKDTLTRAQLGLSYDSITTKPFTQVRKAAAPVVDYLLREFETKKAAWRYARARQDKTGVISSNKLHAYKYAEDIFRRITVTPDAKNHGLVIFIDFSQSMTKMLNATMDQLFSLVIFCRKAGIPHRVYGFADGYPHKITHAPSKTFGAGSVKINPNGTISDPDVKQTMVRYGRFELTASPHMRLLELFNENMNLADFKMMVDYLKVWSTVLSKANAAGVYGNFSNFSAFNLITRLNGTPLDCAIVLARPLIRDFKKETRSDIVNCVFLTDGESSACSVKIDTDGQRPYAIYTNGYTIFVDGVKHKNYIPNRPKEKTKWMYTIPSTHTLTKILRDDGYNVVNFYIEGKHDKKLNEFIRDKEIADEKSKRMQKEYKVNGCIKVDEWQGFNQQYIIRNFQLIADEDFTFEVSGTTKNAIMKSFINARKKRLDARVILKEFVGMIAEKNA